MGSVEVFDEWGAIAQHADEANVIAELKERVNMRHRQRLYREDLEKQQRDVNEFISKYGGIKEEKEALEKQLSLMRKMEDEDLVEMQRRRDEVRAVMEENVRRKNRMQQHTNALKRQADLDELNGLKKVQEEERTSNEVELQRRMKVIDELRLSYAAQEAAKRYENEREKEMDKVYNEQYRQKLLEDDAYRQKVIGSES